MLDVILPLRPGETVKLKGMRELHAVIWTSHAVWYTQKFLGSHELRTLDLVIEPYASGKSLESYVSVLTMFFKSTEILRVWYHLRDVRIVVQDAYLWQALQAPILEFLSKMSHVETLELHTESLTPGFLETMFKLTSHKRLKSIKGVGERKLLILDADDQDDFDGDDGSCTPQPRPDITFHEPNSTQHTLTGLSLYASLPMTTNFLATNYWAGILTRLEVTLSNNPTQNTFANFFRFVGKNCLVLRILRISFSEYHSERPVHTLNWDVIKALENCNDLEALEVEHGPVVELSNTDISRIASAWPNLRILSFTLQDRRVKPFIVPSFGALLCLLERCTSMTELTVPFSTRNPSEKLYAEARKAKSLHVLTTDDDKHLLEVSAETRTQRSLWPDATGLVPINDDDPASGTNNMVIDSHELTMLVHECLERDISGLLNLSTAFLSADVHNEDDIVVNRADNTKVRVLASEKGSRPHHPRNPLTAVSSEVHVETMLLHGEDTLTEDDF